jgi:hypothetical protein
MVVEVLHDLACVEIWGTEQEGVAVANVSILVIRELGLSYAAHLTSG